MISNTKIFNIQRKPSLPLVSKSEIFMPKIEFQIFQFFTDRANKNESDAALVMFNVLSSKSNLYARPNGIMAWFNSGEEQEPHARVIFHSEMAISRLLFALISVGSISVIRRWRSKKETNKIWSPVSIDRKNFVSRKRMNWLERRQSEEKKWKDWWKIQQMRWTWNDCRFLL